MNEFPRSLLARPPASAQMLAEAGELRRAMTVVHRDFTAVTGLSLLPDVAPPVRIISDNSTA